MRLKKKGSVTFYLVFLVIGVIILLIGAFAAPLGILLNSEMFQAGEDILLIANDSIQDINNADVRDSVNDVVDSAYDNTENNIEIIGSMYQYAWVFMLILSVVVLFLFTRSLIEIRGGGIV